MKRRAGISYVSLCVSIQRVNLEFIYEGEIIRVLNDAPSIDKNKSGSNSLSLGNENYKIKSSHPPHIFLVTLDDNLPLLIKLSWPNVMACSFRCDWRGEDLCRCNHHYRQTESERNYEERPSDCGPVWDVSQPDTVGSRCEYWLALN
jgi:hypothetical protein